MAKDRLDILLDTGLIDGSTFGQILEMDEGGDDEFSHGIVFEFFGQAETTFNKMDTALEAKDLKQLSDLGHFLKGSSAALGMTQVKASCEVIQQLGAKKDETGTRDEPDQDVSLSKLKTEIAATKDQYKEVEKALRTFYGD